MKKIMTLAIITFCALNFLYLNYASAEIHHINAALDQAILSARKAEAEQSVRQSLTSKEWVVYMALTQMPSAKQHKSANVASGTDVLSFNDRALKSKNLGEQGYPESNYNLSIADDGSATLETMPTNKEGDQVYIRVELRNGVMSGVMSFRAKKGGKTVYSFSSSGAPQQPEPVAETPKKKK